MCLTCARSAGARSQSVDYAMHTCLSSWLYVPGCSANYVWILLSAFPLLLPSPPAISFCHILLLVTSVLLQVCIRP